MLGLARCPARAVGRRRARDTRREEGLGRAACGSPRGPARRCRWVLRVRVCVCVLLAQVVSLPAVGLRDVAAEGSGSSPSVPPMPRLIVNRW